MKKELHVKYVVFDWGNTLVFDPRYKILEELSREITEKLSQTSNITISPTEVKETFFRIDNSPKYHWVGADHFGQEEKIIQVLLNELGMERRHAVFVAPEILISYRKKWEEQVKSSYLNQEIKETLIELKNRGIKLGIFSNMRPYTLEASLEWMKIRDLFDHIRTSDEVGSHKSPKTLRQFIKENGFEPEETVYIGDDPKRDVEVAKAIGSYTILFIPPKEFVDEKQMAWRNSEVTVKPDATIRKFSELKDVLFKLS